MGCTGAGAGAGVSIFALSAFTSARSASISWWVAGGGEGAGGVGAGVAGGADGAGAGVAGAGKGAGAGAVGVGWSAAGGAAGGGAVCARADPDHENKKAAANIARQLGPAHTTTWELPSFTSRAPPRTLPDPPPPL